MNILELGPNVKADVWHGVCLEREGGCGTKLVAAEFELSVVARKAWFSGIGSVEYRTHACLACTAQVKFYKKNGVNTRDFIGSKK